MVRYEGFVVNSREFAARASASASASEHATAEICGWTTKLAQTVGGDHSVALGRCASVA
jgi:hypothetical protein